MDMSPRFVAEPIPGSDGKIKPVTDFVRIK